MAPLVPCKAIPASPRSSDCNEPRSFAAMRRIRFPLQGTAALLPPPVLGDPPPPAVPGDPPPPFPVLGDPPPPSLLDGPVPPAPACGLDVPAGSPRPHASASGSAANMTFHFIVIPPPKFAPLQAACRNAVTFGAKRGCEPRRTAGGKWL